MEIIYLPDQNIKLLCSEWFSPKEDPDKICFTCEYESWMSDKKDKLLKKVKIDLQYAKTSLIGDIFIEKYDPGCVEVFGEITNHE